MGSFPPAPCSLIPILGPLLPQPYVTLKYTSIFKDKQNLNALTLISVSPDVEDGLSDADMDDGKSTLTNLCYQTCHTVKISMSTYLIHLMDQMFPLNHFDILI